MDNKFNLDELNKQQLQQLEAYMKEKNIEESHEHHDKIKTAKDEWQLAWTKLQETLLTLERLEI